MFHKIIIALLCYIQMGSFALESDMSIIGPTYGIVPPITLIGQEKILRKKGVVETEGYLHITENEVLLYFTPYDYAYNNRESAIVVEKDEARSSFKNTKDILRLEQLEGKRAWIMARCFTFSSEETNGAIAKLQELDMCSLYDRWGMEEETRTVDYAATPIENPEAYWEDAMPVSIYRYIADLSEKYVGMPVELVGVLNIGKDFGEAGETPMIDLGWPYNRKTQVTHQLSLWQVMPSKRKKEPCTMDGTIISGYSKTDGEYIPIYNNDYLGKMVKVRAMPNERISMSSAYLKNPIVELYEIRRTKP
ncbi:hypothetical protein KP626_04205 [Christensenella sp. MSJ-20]|uniref:hypothetical protein n=1 Tax=Christensenella sp. MSJ-20 TaxID=2841518 RepID=UPI001C753CB9|nr:hypothetical protein KP626_04205 [Christensenella sp. MSJ-20]